MAYYKDLENGSYRLFAEAGKDMNGKRDRRSKVVWPSGPRELKRMLLDFEIEVDETPASASKKMSFIALVDYWKINFAKIKWGSITYETNMYLLDIILEHYHPKDIRLIETAHIVEYFTKEKEAGRKSLVKKYEILKSIFKMGTKWGLFEVNPMLGVDKPKHHTKKRPFYDEDEIHQALGVLKDVQEHQSLIVRLALFGALRREEITALGVDVLNLKSNSVHIKRALIWTSEKGLELKATKNEEERTITLPASLMIELNDYYRAQLKLRLELGTAGHTMKDHEGVDVHLIFTQLNGQVIRPDSVTQFWGRIVERYELKKISFHDLRHSSASYMISQGINIKIVQERLGHRNIKTTLNIYSHVTQKDDETASNVFDRNFINPAHTGHILAKDKPTSD